jgi:chromosome partitioning protein
MPTIAIASQKGGSGKTTLALHIATCAAYDGRKACVIDTDPQATAAAWGDWRGDFEPEVITCPPVRLPGTIQKVQRSGAVIVVIDTPPNADAATREAVRAADMVLIPTRLRAFDLHAVQATADLVGLAKTPAYVLLNGVPPRANKLVAETNAYVEGLGLQLCPVSFGERAAFHRAASAGAVAMEAEPDGKAAGEVKALWTWLCERLGLTIKS